MISSSEIKQLLKNTVTVYQDHISEKKALKLPYVVILELSSENIFADNKVHNEIVPIQVILHQAKRDTTLENSIKQIFTNNNIPYNFDTEWDSDNLLYATTFDING